MAAFVTEIFYGGSCINPPPEYIPQLREMTRRLGILWDLVTSGQELTPAAIKNQLKLAKREVESILHQK